jgi:endogenous inhibitor of DNA gyrase (YacG/DUF329 family)
MLEGRIRVLDIAGRNSIIRDMQSVLPRTLESSRAAGRCPTCATKIVVQGEGEVVVKNAILRVDEASGLVTAKCPRCKSWVEVPLRYIG